MYTSSCIDDNKVAARPRASSVRSFRVALLAVMGLQMTNTRSSPTFTSAVIRQFVPMSRPLVYPPRQQRVCWLFRSQISRTDFGSDQFR